MRSQLKGGDVGSLVWKSYPWGPYLMYEKKMISLITLVMDPGGRPHSGPVWASIAHVQNTADRAMCCDETLLL